MASYDDDIVHLYGTSKTAGEKCELSLAVHNRIVCSMNKSRSKNKKDNHTRRATVIEHCNKRRHQKRMLWRSCRNVYDYDAH